MYQKIEKTKFPPTKKPVLVWDGHCGFCEYWVIRWSKITGNTVLYKPYQEVALSFEDIDEFHFKQASRLIELDGRIFSGAHSAYRTLRYGNKRLSFLDMWYTKSTIFAKISDALYQLIAKNRPFWFRVTKLLFGSDPEQPRPFWIIYLAVSLYLIYI